MAKRQNQLLPLAIMDLDYFKQVNDQCGHPTGDQLLQEIAEILKVTFRETDIIARIGGDEFAIIMINPEDYDAICQPAERVIESLRKLTRVNDHDIRIGASFGVATYPIDSESPSQLYRLADQALYQAKESGKNRCSLVNKIQVTDCESDQLAVES